MMMFLGLMFGIGTIVAPIIVCIKTKGQKRRGLKVLASSIACFILMGVCAVNDNADTSTQPTHTAQTAQTAQVQKTLEDVIEGRGFTIVSAEGGLLMVKKNISVVTNSGAISKMRVETRDLLKDIIENGYADLGDYDTITISFVSDDFVDRYGSKVTLATGFYIFEEDVIQKITDIDKANIDKLATSHGISHLLRD